MPGTDYGLVKRGNLKKHASATTDDATQSKTEKLTVEELEQRVAMSVPDQKKNPNPAPYMPGTDYGLVKRGNLKKHASETTDDATQSKTEKLTVEELEQRVAMSVPDQKKNPNPAPYMPGTYYGLVNRKNL
jgi:uncharacterized small protein (DUF1192 family)